MKHYFCLYIVMNTTIPENARMTGIRGSRAGTVRAVRETVDLLGVTSTVAPPGVVIHRNITIQMPRGRVLFPPPQIRYPSPTDTPNLSPTEAIFQQCWNLLTVVARFARWLQLAFGVGTCSLHSLVPLPNGKFARRTNSEPINGRARKAAKSCNNRRANALRV